MAINFLPLLLLGGGAVAIMATGKKKKKKAEPKEPLVIEPKRPPREEPKPTLKLPVECATRVDASLRHDEFEYVATTGRPLIMSFSCSGNGFSAVFDKVCKAYSSEMDFWLALLDDMSNPEDKSLAEEMCGKQFNNGAVLIVMVPATETIMDPSGEPYTVRGVTKYGWENIPALRFDPTKNEARIVIAKALDFAKGATHPSSAFTPWEGYA